MADLSPSQKKFILHWGEMGTRWGINRTVAQIHALLFLSSAPLTAEDIAEALSVARSNVSTSLRELQAWGLVRVVHLLGDRRDHFQALKDVWEMFQLILDGRKRREVDPTLAVLRECVAESRAGSDAESRARLLELLGFFEMTTSWYEQVRRLPRPTLTKFIRMGERVTRLLDTGS
ncbi:MAG TPA: MarR family transcriptional regulator [Vicinamibacteria bacterium]|jgi:DNA-binding transcriptional regulator GbsR (MarR family)